MNLRQRSYLVFILVALIWGINWPIMKVAVGLMHPLWFATARVGLGCLSAFLFLLAIRALKMPTRQDLPILLSVGILQLAGAQLLIHAGLAYVPAGKSAVLSYTTPLWVLPGAYLFLGERLNVRGILGLCLGLLGLVLLIDPQTLENNWKGNVLLLTAAFCWAGAILHSRAHHWHLEPQQLLPWQLLIGFLVMVPLSFLLAGPLQADWSSEFLYWALLYNGPFATAFAVWGVISAQKNLPAVTASITFLIVPAIGILAALVWLKEIPDERLLLGFGLILTGVFCSIKGTSDKKSIGIAVKD